ncbi:alpha/beta hydrolase [Patescibacteria group bacterium]|nr:alpha/beta hydrolase [Patescibacteria group bacterium]
MLFFKSLNKLNNLTNDIFLLQSIDDPIVPVTNAQKYHKELSNSKVIMFKDKGHFNQNTFPELERLIRKLYV